MEDRKILESLILFIREEIREFKKPIDSKTLIEDNLGVTGDEAADFILNYSKRFNVDTSKFIFAKYFNEEPSVFLEKKRINSLTVGDLGKAIIAGHLNDEIINS